MRGNERITAIIQTLSGLSSIEAVKALAGALVHVAADLDAKTTYPREIRQVKQAVPVKKLKVFPFQPVWDYLEAVNEYDSVQKLRVALVSRFGKVGTPSLSHLHRHLQANRAAGSEVRA
jgi:hypothetical protein